MTYIGFLIFTVFVGRLVSFLFFYFNPKNYIFKCFGQVSALLFMIFYVILSMDAAIFLPSTPKHLLIGLCFFVGFMFKELMKLIKNKK